MSTQPHQPPNEELLGLLREVEGVEDRVLFKRVATGRGLSPFPGVLSARATSVSSLEKHLLATHREELGRLLTDACLRIFLAGPTKGGFDIPHYVDGSPVLPTPLDHWQKQCRKTRSICPDPPKLEGPMGVLDRLIAPNAMGPNLLDVARAGLLIASSDALKSYVSHGLLLTGDTLGSKKGFGELHQTAMNRANRPIAATALARVAHVQGDLASTLEWQRISASDSRPDFYGVLGWLFSAVQAGDKQASGHAASILTTQFEGKEEAIDLFCSRKRAEHLAKNWQPIGAAKRIASHTNNSHVEKVFSLFR